MAIEASAANFFKLLGLNDCPIAKLADDDLAAIFKYLPPFERLIVSEVCAKWRYISQTPWQDISHLDLSQVPTAYIHAVMKKCPNLTSVSTLRQHLGDFCRFASRLSNITSLKCVESTFTMDLNVPRRYDLEHSLEFATWSELIWHNSKSVVTCSGASAREYLLPYGRPATLRRLQLSDVSVLLQEHINDVDRILHPSPLQLECFILAFANIPQNDYFHRFCFYAHLDYYLAYVTHLRELYLDAPDRFSLPGLTRSLPELKILFLNNVILVEDTFKYFLTHHPSLCVAVITASRPPDRDYGASIFIPVRKLYPDGLDAPSVPPLHLFLGKMAAEKLRFEPLKNNDALKVYPINAPLPEFLKKEEVMAIFEGSWIASRIKDGARDGVNLADYSYEGNTEGISYSQE